MRQVVVVERPESWGLALPGVDIVSADAYLTDASLAAAKRTNVFNMCRTYAHQTVGYYVSLLAEARGHRPLPSVTTLQDLRSSSILRVAGDDMATEIERTLRPLKGDTFELSIYFGRNMARRYDRLAGALFNHFPAPFLRASFARGSRWRLQALRPVAEGDIPESHYEFVNERAKAYFSRRIPIKSRGSARYDIAVLINPEEVDAPSDSRALARFVKAATRYGARVATITKTDFGRLGEFDALFIRETTSVDHHTYRFARRAEALGLAVIDDPTSIVRCCNKVFQAEVFARNNVPTPKTIIAHKGTDIASELRLPCVLKRPDSAFSAGVVKVADPEELAARLSDFFDHSELLVAQEYLPTEFDWRIGVLDGRPVWACKYHMVRGHWQIQMANGERRRRYGAVESFDVGEVPRPVIDLALRASSLIGRGLYGVDIKELDNRCIVMEVNDNPNLESGVEDAVGGDAVYEVIVRSLIARIEGTAVEAVAEAKA